MSNEQARALLDDATLAVQTGRYGDALPLVDQALALDPDNYEAFVVRGIALSQTNKPAEATEAFRKSIALNPNVPKPHYNLAVHLYGMGQREQALEALRAALRADPSHEGSLSLSRKIEQELGMAGPSPEAPMPVGEPTEGGAEYYRSAYREGYDSDPEAVHSIPIVEKMGSNWMIIGWVLVALPILLFALTLFISPGMAFSGPQQGANAQQAFANISPLVWVLTFSRLIAIFAGLTWMIMDVLDRRLNLVWIIPYVFCCCCGFGILQAATQATYMLVGRKTR